MSLTLTITYAIESPRHLLFPKFESCSIYLYVPDIKWSLQTLTKLLGFEERSSLRILASQVARRSLLRACFSSFGLVIIAGSRK